MRSFTAGRGPTLCSICGEPLPEMVSATFGDVPSVPTRTAPLGTEYIVHKLTLTYILVYVFSRATAARESGRVDRMPMRDGGWARGTGAGEGARWDDKNELLSALCAHCVDVQCI